MVTREPTSYKPPVLRYAKTAYAQSRNEHLPRQYGVICAIGPRGSGKTYGVTQLLKAYEDSPPVNSDGTKQAIRVIVISPTYDQQECFKALRSIDENDVYRTYEPSILQEILDSIEHEKQETERYQKEVALYKKFSRIRTLNQLTSEELMTLDAHDFEPPTRPPRYPNGCSSFLLVDDLVGSAIYRNGRNPFMTLLLRNRHVRTNIILCCQSMRVVPKTIRANVSCWIVYRFGQKSVLQDLFEEAGADVPESTFFELYDEATNDPHESLVIDFSKPKDKRFSQSFKTILRP